MHVSRFQHTYRRHVLAAIALPRDEQRAPPQMFVLCKEALQTDVEVRCNLQLIRGDTLLACTLAAGCGLWYQHQPRHTDMPQLPIQPLLLPQVSESSAESGCCLHTVLSVSDVAPTKISDHAGFFRGSSGLATSTDSWARAHAPMQTWECPCSLQIASEGCVGSERLQADRPAMLKPVPTGWSMNRRSYFWFQLPAHIHTPV